MRERLFSAVRPTARRASVAIDLVVLTPLGSELGVLLVRSMDPRSRESWMLPWDAPRDVETLDEGADRVLRAALGGAPARLEQVATLGDGLVHPGDAELSVAFCAFVPTGLDPSGTAGAWHPLGALPPLSPRHATVVSRAVQAVRKRTDVATVALALLPERFTLVELQTIHELLLGRRLHKASFRRWLRAAALVAPADGYRTGRGRPARLYGATP